MSCGPAPRAKFVPAVEPGSPMHVWMLRRQRWRQAADDWLADGRPDFLVVEPTTEAISETASEGEAR